MKKLSTTKLSKKLNVLSRDLFDKMVNEKLIYKNINQFGF